MFTNFNLEDSSILIITLEKIIQENDEDFPKEVSIVLITEQNEENASYIFGALKLLSSLGLIEINADTVIVKSKYSNIALCAIKKRMELGIPFNKHLRDENLKEYYKTFTKNLEIIRQDFQGNGDPIHYRKIINLIIKGRQIKNFKYRDVFFHVFHQGWNQYHLLGLGYRGESSNQLIEKAMLIKLELNESDYEVDQNINPQNVNYDLISEAHGAVTHYEIETYVIKKINLDIHKHVRKLIEKHDDISSSDFKWFSLEEIKQKENENLKIMQSTLLVLNKFEDTKIPLAVEKAKSFDLKKFPSFTIRTDIGDFVRMRTLVIIIIGLISYLILKFIFNFANNNSFMMENINTYLEVFVTIITFVILIIEKAFDNGSK